MKGEMRLNDNTDTIPGFGASVRVNGGPQQPLRLLRLPEVTDRVAMGKSTIYAMINRNEFPAPMHFGKASRWLESEIDDWICQQLMNRKQAGQH
jgi:prophage regulatory protein